MSLSPSRSISACLHCLIPHKTSLTIIPSSLNQSSIDTILTLLATIQVQHAELSYSHVAAHVNDRKQAQSVVHVQLLTGRKHQIRAQLSSAGHHVVGDGKYGAPQRFKLERDIALHAYAAVFSHPIQRSKRMVITAALPHSWARFMGGEKESAALAQTLETTLKVKLGDGDGDGNSVNM